MNISKSILEKIQKSNKVVFVTGAGISQESGIPTFRGKDGLWRNHDAMKLASIDAFYEDPVLVWQWYNQRRRNIIDAQPNDGHRAIAELEKYTNAIILTQNIDGLHQRAGSSKVVELHGNILRVKCVACDFKDEILEDFADTAPLCKCGELLRPDVVWFGEALPKDVWEYAMDTARDCDLMIVVGTSLAVSPANMLPSYAKQNNAILVEVNPDNTEMSSYMDVIIRKKSADALHELLSIFAK